ncbi:MAG: hypothetical protein AB7G28_03115 [Pirellulales bacterium]
MTNHFRPFCALVIALLASDASIEHAAAQGFSIGGVKVQSKSNASNRNQSNEDDDVNNGSNQSGGRRSRSRNQSGDQSNDNMPEGFQQFIPGQNNNNGGQGGQQNNPSQFRRPNQQGNFPNNGQFNNGPQGNQNGFNIGVWNGGKWQGPRDAKQWTQAFGGNQQPFSSQWYKDHPKAWKYDNGNDNNNVNVWVGGTLPGLYSWLGWGNVPQQYRVYYSQNSSSQFNPNHYGQWYPLGVFSLMAGPGDPGTRMVQLAVDQHGHIAGNYYDMITNSNYSLTGDIRQQSQRASWSLNKNQFVRFRAPVYQLLQPYGSLTVSLPGGDQQWQFVRLEN